MPKRKVIKQSGNMPTTPITWKQIIGSKAFRIGYEEVLAGKPFQYDAFQGKDAWHYERGRQFAASGYNDKLTEDEPKVHPKTGNKVLNEAIYSFQESYRMKHII